MSMTQSQPQVAQMVDKKPRKKSFQKLFKLNSKVQIQTCYQSFTILLLCDDTTRCLLLLKEKYKKPDWNLIKCMMRSYKVSGRMSFQTDETRVKLFGKSNQLNDVKNKFQRKEHIPTVKVMFWSCFAVSDSVSASLSRHPRKKLSSASVTAHGSSMHQCLYSPQACMRASSWGKVTLFSRQSTWVIEVSRPH